MFKSRYCGFVFLGDHPESEDAHERFHNDVKEQRKRCRKNVVNENPEKLRLRIMAERRLEEGE